MLSDTESTASAQSQETALLEPGDNKEEDAVVSGEDSGGGTPGRTLGWTLRRSRSPASPCKPTSGATWAKGLHAEDAPHDKKMCSAIMSQKASRRPSFDLRLHWLGVSSQNMQHLRWSAVEVGGLGSVWVLSRGAPHQGQEGPPENLFCSVGVKVNFWPCGCPKSAARPASATS